MTGLTRSAAARIIAGHFGTQATHVGGAYDSYAAACGVSDQVLWQMMKDNPGIRRVCLCLDHDEPGQAAARRIAEKLKEHGISHMGRVVLGRIEKRIPAMLFVDPV